MAYLRSKSTTLSVSTLLPIFLLLTVRTVAENNGNRAAIVVTYKISVLQFLNSCTRALFEFVSETLDNIRRTVLN